MKYNLMVDVLGIQEELAKFAAERDWERFHSPKNLSMALAGEAGELLEVFHLENGGRDDEILRPHAWPFCSR